MTLPQGTIRNRTDGTIQQKQGKKWVYIGYVKKPKAIFPPVTLPDHIKPTKYPHYYISNDGIAYREPRQCDRTGVYGEVNKWGLIQLNTSLRGNPNYGEEYMYEGTNIYLYDENGKNVGSKKRNIHQLVAETWIPNPYGHTEVLHGDKGNRCNHYTNLRWGTHKENMEESSSTLPDGSQRRSHGGEGSLYEKKDGEWVLVPKVDKKTGKFIPWNKGKTYKMPETYKAWNELPDGTVRIRNDRKYIKHDGKWVYQKKEKKDRKPRKPKNLIPEGTVKYNKNGYPYKMINGKWVYQKKERVEGYIETGPDVKYDKKGQKYKMIDGKWIYQKKIKQT